MEASERTGVSPTVPTHTGFYSQRLWGLIFGGLELCAAWSSLGLGSFASQWSITARECGTSPSVGCCFAATTLPSHVLSSLHFFPVWMNVSSLNPWLLDFHTVQFSDSSVCFLFWNWLLILLLVVRGSRAYLLMPPCGWKFSLPVFKLLLYWMFTWLL